MLLQEGLQITKKAVCIRSLRMFNSKVMNLRYLCNKATNGEIYLI